MLRPVIAMLMACALAVPVCLAAQPPKTSVPKTAAPNTSVPDTRMPAAALKPGQNT